MDLVSWIRTKRFLLCLGVLNEKLGNKNVKNIIYRYTVKKLNKTLWIKKERKIVHYNYILYTLQSRGRKPKNKKSSSEK